MRAARSPRTEATVHRRAGSLSGAAPLQPPGIKRRILPDKGGFCQDSLSVITAVLPSKKSFARSGTLLADEKTRRVIDSTPVPAQHWWRPQSLAVLRLHPKFTINRAKWVD